MAPRRSSRQDLTRQMTLDGPKRILIVDDSRIVRERLCSMISELPGVEVVGEADIAFEAISAIRRLKPDLVVLDISMPGGSGIYVLETIKRELPTPIVVMLTNFYNEAYQQKCLQLGVDHFLDKTTQFEKVLDIIRGLDASFAAS